MVLGEATSGSLGSGIGHRSSMSEYIDLPLTQKGVEHDKPPQDAAMVTLA
jgi:hypothetical protein